MKSWYEMCLDMGIGYIEPLKGNKGVMTAYPAKSAKRS